MADIITYPENGITYDADDASGYLATRLSGVYSAEEDFAVTAVEGLSVQVSAGQAWVRPARFKGRSIIMARSETLTLTAADAVRSRIDRVVLRYDAAAQKTMLKVLEGIPDSVTPAAPAISRTELLYDLCLAEIARKAGSEAITAADITDTRADETVCGVMRDGVTAIPTEGLINQWNEKADAQIQNWKKKASALDAETKKLQDGSLCTKEELAKALGNLKSELVAVSGSNYVRFSDGTQICWGSIGSKSFEVTGNVHYKSGEDSDGNAVYKDVTKTTSYSTAAIIFPQPFANGAYSLAFQVSYGVSDASVFNGKSYTWEETGTHPIIGGTYTTKYTGNFTSISSASPAMGRQATYCTLGNGAWGDYIAIGRWK